MTFKKWIVGTPDRDTAKQVAAELGKDPFAVMLAQLRGITDIDEVEYYLSDELLITSPDELVDIQSAADIINEYINEGLKIAVFGDYDCDGVCASAIMYKYLKSRGADVLVYIPDRINEGYGMNTAAIDFINKKECKLIITVDNGIACKSEIDYAASLGIVTVITDHHLPPSSLPDAAAVVDPNRTDCPSTFKEICGAEVAYKVICKTDDSEPEELLDDYADLLAVATIGDSMPLIKENRSIVKYGIKRIIENSNIGLTAVLSVAGIDKSALDSGKVSFGIVPRINAAGRMGDAKRAFDLLTVSDYDSAVKLAEEIDFENAKRQKTEKEIADSVVEIIETNGYNHDRVIVASGEGFHLGVLGIAAMKICDKYGKPTIIFSSDGKMLKGSCRSVGNFNIYNALKYCEDLIDKYGGHSMAAGLTVKQDNLAVFREKINDYALLFEPTVPTVYLDFKLNPASISIDMVNAIRTLEPFGNDNPSPMFGIFGATLKNVSPLSGGKHLKLLFEKGGSSFNALLFGVNTEKLCFDIGAVLDLAVMLDLNTYMNRTNVSVIIRGIRPSGINQDMIIRDLFAVDDYYARGVINADLLAVTREEIGTVYKFILKNAVTEEALLYKLCGTLGMAKSIVSLNILKELGLVDNASGQFLVAKSEKTDLSRSKTYNALSKGGETDD